MGGLGLPAGLRSQVAAVVGFVMLAAASPASATTYCVNDATCSGTSEPDVQTALSAAAGNAGKDTVQIGAGKYSHQHGFDYQGATGNEVAIVGAGTGQTTLTMPGDDTSSESVLHLLGGGGTSVADLTLRIPAESSLNNFADTDLFLDNAKATHVNVTGPSSVNNDRGVLTYGTSSFTKGAVTLPNASPYINIGVAAFGGTLTVKQSSIATNFPLQSEADVVADRVTLTPADDWYGGETDAGSIEISNSLIKLGNHTNVVGLDASNPRTGAAYNMSIDADHVTIVGGGSASIGVRAEATASIDNGSQTATVTLENSTIKGPATSIDRQARNLSTTSPGTNVANVTSHYSNYKKSTVVDSNGTNGSGQIKAHNFVLGTPTFVSPSTGDYTPASGSILVDEGDPLFTGGLDLAGNPRVVDGDGNGSAITDIGAYERQ